MVAIIFGYLEILLSIYFSIMINICVGNEKKKCTDLGNLNRAFEDKKNPEGMAQTSV